MFGGHVLHLVLLAQGSALFAVFGGPGGCRVCIIASWHGALLCSLRVWWRGPALCLLCIYKYTLATRVFQLDLLSSVHAPQRALLAVLREPAFSLRSSQCDVKVVM